MGPRDRKEGEGGRRRQGNGRRGQNAVMRVRERNVIQTKRANLALQGRSLCGVDAFLKPLAETQKIRGSGARGCPWVAEKTQFWSYEFGRTGVRGKT